MINSTNNKHKAFAVKKAAALATAALLLAAALVFTGCKQTVDSPAGAGGGTTGPGGGAAPGEIIVGISAYAIGWYNPSDNEYVDSIKFKTKAGQSWAQLKAEAEIKIQAELGESTVYELAGEWYRDESKWDGGTLLTDDFVFTQSIDIYPVVKRKDITVTVALAAGEPHLSLADPANPSFTTGMGMPWKEGLKQEAAKKITVPSGRLIVWEKEDGTAITDNTLIISSCTIRARSVPDTSDNFIIEPPLSDTSATEHVLKGRKADPIGEITIPEGVTKIGEKALAYCAAVTKVHFPSSLKKIDYKAFEKCTGITGELNLTPCTQLKEVSGFSGCTGITSVKAPSQVTSITFDYCTGFTGEVDLSAYTQLKYVKFINCPNITGTKLPSSVIEVMVSGCTGIQNIADLNLPASIKYLSCKRCTGLTGLLDLSPYTQMKTIRPEAFKYCTGITDIKLPAAIEKIDEDAFAFCNGLTGEIDFSSYTQLKKLRGFACCSGLTNVKLPPSVTYVSFESCRGLHNFAELNIPASIEYIYFRDCGFTGEVDLSSYTQLRFIAQYAFDLCDGITAVKLPENIEWINPMSFRGCSNLRSIEIHSVKQDSKDKPKLQEVWADSFEDVPADAHFIIKVRESNAALKQQMAQEIKQLLIEKAGIRESQIMIAE